jgi:hypothetical protein
MSARASIVASFVCAVALGGVVACSSSSTPGTAAAPAPEPTSSLPDDAGDPPATEEKDASSEPSQPADACGTVPKSLCTPANAGSVIRGIVKFDPAHYAAKKAPSLVVFLHHQITVSAKESSQGGHPHAYKTVPVKDVAKGEASFAIDMCELGTAMYSEENCGFNLVVMLDEDGSNDPDANGATAMIAQKGELVKMTPIDISCHKPSPCMTIAADCADGDTCTTFTALKACKCAAQTCTSDDTICTK